MIQDSSGTSVMVKKQLSRNKNKWLRRKEQWQSVNSTFNSIKKFQRISFSKLIREGSHERYSDFEKKFSPTKRSLNKNLKNSLLTLKKKVHTAPNTQILNRRRQKLLTSSKKPIILMKQSREMLPNVKELLNPVFLPNGKRPLRPMVSIKNYKHKFTELENKDQGIKDNKASFTPKQKDTKQSPLLASESTS
mmetsp:Transcript_26202/g.26091  ORF Transcript_26202/g.26091 Transcript_26202/m.26091 type:complete len:192 (+) Transcript_26202:2-577(+)